jgi:hypothetical protein
MDGKAQIRARLAAVAGPASLDVGPGWLPTVERLLDDLEALPPAERPRLHELKQKFGD